MSQKNQAKTQPAPAAKAGPQPAKHVLSKAAFDALTEMEQARLQSNALLHLMNDSETIRMMEGDFEETKRNAINAGVTLLVNETTARMDEAFDSLFSHLCPKPAPGAATI